MKSENKTNKRGCGKEFEYKLFNGKLFKIKCGKEKAWENKLCPECQIKGIAIGEHQKGYKPADTSKSQTLDENCQCDLIKGYGIDGICWYCYQEFIRQFKEIIRWRIKAMNRGEYTPQQTSLNIRKDFDKLSGLGK